MFNSFDIDPCFESFGNNDSFYCNSSNLGENNKEDIINFDPINMLNSGSHSYETWDSSKNIINFSNFYYIQKETKEINIEDIQLKKVKSIKNNLENNKKKNLGRKNKKSTQKVFHTKHFEDNKTSKVKIIILKSVMEHINNQLKNEDGKDLKRLLRLEKNKNNTVQYNQAFLYTNLKDIFSAKINRKYKNINENHNKSLISKLLDENDEEKKEKYNKIFNLTFAQCLRYYRNPKDNYIKELDGMKTLKDLSIKKDENENDDEYQEYLNELIKYIENFEEIIKKKKGRKRNNNIKKINDTFLIK